MEETPFFLEKNRRAASQRRHHRHRKMKNARSAPMVKWMINRNSETDQDERDKKVYLGRFVTTPKSCTKICCKNHRKTMAGKRQHELTRKELMAGVVEYEQLNELAQVEAVTKK